jgi:hypothetical protein
VVHLGINDLIRRDQDHQEYHRCHFHDCNQYEQMIRLQLYFILLHQLYFRLKLYFLILLQLYHSLQEDHQCLYCDHLLKQNFSIYFFYDFVFIETLTEYQFAKEYHQEDRFPKQKKFLIQYS